MARLNSAHILRGGVLTVTMGLVAATATIWASARFFAAPSTSASVVSSMDLRMYLSIGGFSPPKLAAAGITSNAVGTLLSNARRHIDDNPRALSGSLKAIATAQMEVDRLEALVQQGKAVDGTKTALVGARASLVTAQADRAAAMNSFVIATQAALSEDQKSKLAAIRANVAFSVPVQYSITERTPAQWAALRNALASNAVRTRTGEALDPECNDIVMGADAEQATAAAVQSLIMHLASVQSTYNAALRS